MLSSIDYSRNITIRDVAEKAGVTMTTVSSALHDRGRVSPEQRTRIRKIARELGYQPKLAAQLLRARTTSCVGLILPNSSTTEDGLDGHGSPILRHFVRACESRGLRYHVEFMGNGESNTFSPPAQVAGGMVDGVLVGGYVGEELTQWLEARQCRWVAVDEPAEYCVVTAADEGMYRAVERLAALGHHRVAYCGGTRQYHTQKSAYAGFLKAVEDFQLDLHQDTDVATFESMTRPESLRAASVWGKAMLQQDHAPTAVLCHDLMYARGVCHAALTGGLSIPEDLSVIAVGPAADAEKSLPCLSTVQMNFKGLVEAAMTLLEERLNRKKATPKTVKITPDLVMRDTVTHRKTSR